MRYRALNTYLKSVFGEKVFKVSIDMGAACPTRDGSKGSGGCIFCNPAGMKAVSETETGALPPISRQLIEGIEYIKSRHKARKFISYFHQHTNTYGAIPQLSSSFAEALDHPDVVGLAISTRPDCIPEEAVDLLSFFNKKTFMWVELGLQTANDDILKFLGRGHTVVDFSDAVIRLHERGISVCAHIMIGLPGETDDDIIKTIRLINSLKVEGIKIHNLHVLKNTPLEKMYNDGKIRLLSLDEYAKKVVLALKHLDPKVLVHRFNSHSPRHLTVAPEWSVNKLATFNAVEAELERQDARQGSSA